MADGDGIPGLDMVALAVGVIRFMQVDGMALFMAVTGTGIMVALKAVTMPAIMEV